MLPTIFAPGTPAGRSALSVLRITGPEALSITRQLAPSVTLVPRRAKLVKLYTPEKSNRKLLDEALVLFFKSPNSYTGEDIIEFYLHGSPAVSRAVQSAIISTKLARFAEPGEFTKRAFHNNRLDLAQVEGIRDLLAAETELQRQSSVGTAAGVHSLQYETWRTSILHAIAMLTASIDFSEDNELSEDGKGRVSSSIEDSSMAKVRIDVTLVREQINSALEISRNCSELVKSGVRVALLGEPNAGKSSLTNRLVQRSACLVSDVPGTTRDVLEVGLEVGGHKVVLFDTAGIREASDTVEQLGIGRAREILDTAHIVIALTPSDSDPSEDITSELHRLSHKTVIKLRSKSDLLMERPIDDGHHIAISSTTGEGIDELLATLTNHCNALVNDENIDTNDRIGLGMSTRVRGLLESEALPGLDACLQLLSTDVVLANAELQSAAVAIGNITGQCISVHEVLGVVFGEFCIGK